MNKPQTIEVNGAKAVVLSLRDYERLVERAEMLGDIESFDSAMARLASGEETFPAAVAKRLASGESPIRVFREFRGLSQRDLAEAASVSVPAISKIESTGKASLETMKAIAMRLHVDLDDLV